MVKRSDEKFIKLCKSEKCSGCSACFNVCPTSSISMHEDKYSEIHPVLNRDTCIQCGLCQKVCPQINGMQFKDCIECYAAWRNDEDKRKHSSSGGVAALLYEKFLNADYVCYGVKFDFKKGAYYTAITSMKDIDQIKGSKYVQANVGDIFKDIGSRLKDTRCIVFVGTPCQVAGLENFINTTSKDYRDNIILIDFLCHGTVPKSYLLDEIHNIENKKKYHADGISFRSNIPKRNYYFSLYDHEKVFYSKKAEAQPYFYGFLNSIFCRESCVDCPYKYHQRVGDVTLGDFIGLGKNSPIEIPHGVNPSLVLINSNQGKKIIKMIQNECTLIERNFNEAVSGGPSLKQKNVDNDLRRKFRRLFTAGGYNYAKKKTINKKMLVDLFLTRFIKFGRRVIRKFAKIIRWKKI